MPPPLHRLAQYLGLVDTGRPEPLSPRQQVWYLAGCWIGGVLLIAGVVVPSDGLRIILGAIGVLLLMSLYACGCVIKRRTRRSRDVQ